MIRIFQFQGLYSNLLINIFVSNLIAAATSGLDGFIESLNITGELSSASMVGVRNSLKALCGYGQAEFQVGINSTLRV